LTQRHRITLTDLHFPIGSDTNAPAAHCIEIGYARRRRKCNRRGLFLRRSTPGNCRPGKSALLLHKLSIKICIAAELLFQKSPKNLTEISSFVPDVHDLPEKSTVPAANQYLVKSHFPLNSIHGFPHMATTARSSISFVIPEMLCCPIIAMCELNRIT
jgi:hypothetical protein